MLANEYTLQQTVGALYIDHHQWLRAWLRGKLGCNEQAADLAQDTFLRMMHGKRNVHALEQPRAYLTQIAKHLLIDHWRRQAVERAWQETLAVAPETFVASPEERALILEALVRIDQLLDCLKPKVREAFLLSQLDGLGYRDIAERLGVGERMVKKYMAQAMLACLMMDEGP
ncbi:sigma-70 family RNA polymerase sigma factor [Methylophilus sp. VKM B-3414]|uniref:sigma-70 family RNA polymerase sigma factor n=1 Tax=Methylophilus sp. VKM B-3414 TaxID=3076121 RepID=UPI0028C82E1A|nr:sigma-70 family RNA polymerase sigma factor [Methylophilus sp. VKM B-3414]MDT7848197.1 sigma-70 family RNA polymerase sigma factor [Methylophilus sp. VKM B-3414]